MSWKQKITGTEVTGNGEGLQKNVSRTDKMRTDRR